MADARHGPLDLVLLGGADGLDREVTIPYIQKTGLALAGFEEHLQPGRLLIFGESEIRFLEQLSSAERIARLRAAFGRDLPCVLIAGIADVPAELIREADAAALPVLLTLCSVPESIGILTAQLEDSLAVREVVHGALLDVLGLGVLIVGDSGIGKSECALELVTRGHRLVADDGVEVRRCGSRVLIGACPDLTRHQMEIRGLGIIDVKAMYGVAATRPSKRVELVVRFERWDPGRRYDRLGLDEAHHDLLDIAVPFVCLPVAPGRNLAILVEVAVRVQLLRADGYRAPDRLVAELERRLERAAAEMAQGDD
jgi:HPr kinase/phosphorylase|tara:strand:- start:717 stop:1652 length:936 start_codon:yes stop_codon:yes gene_type:complete